MNVPDDASIVYVGCTEPGKAVLETLIERGCPVTEIVTIDPEMGERAGVCGYADLGEIGETHDVPVYYPETYGMRNDVDLDHFQTLSADLMVVNGWQRLIPADILETLTHGALGNHGSAFGLPNGRGRSPLNWSLIEDRDRFLLSVIKLDPGADSGAIVTTRKFDVNRYDDIRTLYYKVTLLLQEMLSEVVGPIVRGEWEFEAQTGEPTYYPKRNPEDGEIHWGDGTKPVYDLVRAVARPYPGAFTFHGGEKIMIWEARPFSADVAKTADAGTIVEVFWTDDFVVATGDGTMLVTDWEADDWEPRTGQRLESRGEHDRVDGAEHEHNLTNSDDD